MLTTNDVLPCTHVNPFDPTDHETPDEATQWHCPDCGYDCEIPQQDDVEEPYLCPDCYAKQLYDECYCRYDADRILNRRYVLSDREASDLVGSVWAKLANPQPLTDATADTARRAIWDCIDSLWGGGK